MTHPVNSADISFPFRCVELENGLKVVLQPDHSTSLVGVHVMYHVGSKDERPGRTGFAHLFEHLLFQGSQNVAEAEHFRYIQDAGGTLNGTTWFDRTNYFEVVPSSELDLALWLESDRMGFFLPAITQDKLDNQRDVVKNERRQSYENRPYGLAAETVLRAAFPEGHPYRHPTIGYMEDLDAASLKDVRRFFNTFYGPNNAVLVITGDIDPDDALARVERYFGDIPRGPEPPRNEIPDQLPVGERRETIEDRVQVPRVYMMHHSPSYNEPDFEASAVLTSLLAQGKSSRLYQDLVYDQRVAGSVQAYVWPTERVGMFWVVATGRPGVDADTLEEAMSATLRGAIESLPDEAEVVGARNRARRHMVRTLSGVGMRASAFAHAVTLRGDPEYVNQSFSRYASVSVEDVARVSTEVLQPERRTIVRVVGPGSNGGSSEDAQ